MKQSNCFLVRKIRIISGQWRGRKLFVSNNSGMRPTTSRMRKILFSWLSESIDNANCLDCFSGSGALGIEALSRYAFSTTFLEINYKTANRIQKNITLLQAKRAKVLNVNTLSFLSREGKPYDIAFVDPPFRSELLQRTLNLLEKNGWLKADSLIYVENETKNHPVVPAYWSLHREKKVGQAFCRLYHRESRKKIL